MPPNFESTEASLYNGISQQSAELRLPSQVTDSVNMSLSVARGVERRPPGEIVISDESFVLQTDAKIHEIPLDDDLSYIMLAGSTFNDYKVFDTSGNEYPLILSAPEAETYITTAPEGGGTFSPHEHLQFNTILDYTFVCNRNVVALMETDLQPVAVHKAYIWIKNGVQEVARTVEIDGGTVSVTAPKIANNDTGANVDTFVNDLNLAVNVTAVKLSESVFSVELDSGLPFTIIATDTYGDTTMVAAMTRGCKFEDLPPIADDGIVMTITPEENEDKEYHLAFDDVARVWAEVAAPGEHYAINQDTMPHAFIRKADDAGGTVTGFPFQIYFELEPLAYTSRDSGGDAVNPLPSFIGGYISSAFFFKNRLGFVSGENVVLSATDDIFRFWPKTVKSVLDDDPVDTTISSTRSITLSHAAVFPESMILLGDGEQFNLGSGTKPFTPENVQLDPTTSIAASHNVEPLTIGSSIYFLAPQSSFNSMREYSVQVDNIVADAVDVTGHVPKLLPSTIKQIIAESNLDYIFAIDDADEEEECAGYNVFVYKFFWQGNEKVQSAWHRWNLWFRPIGGITFNGFLYLVGQEKYSEGTVRTVIAKFDLSDKPPVQIADDGEPYKIPRPYIDRLGIPTSTTVTETPTHITICVSAEDSDIGDVDCGELVLVDRVSGELHTFVGKSPNAGGGYCFTFKKPTVIVDTEVTDPECLKLGIYTLGNCIPFNT